MLYKRLISGLLFTASLNIGYHTFNLYGADVKLSLNKSEVNKAINKGIIDNSSFQWAWKKLHNQVSYSGKRLTEEEPKIIPTDEILIDKKGLLIAMDKSRFLSLNNLEIKHKNKIIFKKPIVKDYVYIPANKFQYGETYTITLDAITNTTKIKVNEEFYVLPKSEHDKFYKDLESLTKNESNQKNSKFLKAVLYYSNGYDYNGNAQIYKVRNGL